MNAMHGSIRLELGTVFFASEKGSLQCVFEDNCRHRLRARFNAGIIILFNFCRLCIDFFLRRIGSLEKEVACLNTT